MYTLCIFLCVERFSVARLTVTLSQAVTLIKICKNEAFGAKSRPNAKPDFDNIYATKKRAINGILNWIFWRVRKVFRTNPNHVVRKRYNMLNRPVFCKKRPVHEPIINPYELCLNTVCI